ncbi:MAG: HlyC/CorC family transporter [Pseudomonadales bacterium]|nr:HlyC/CorC family transporter [Pseudomonadales bacterium]
MENLPPSFLIVVLIVLVVVSGFFSGSETAMMALNRYRLKHLVSQNNSNAKRVLGLLQRPDRLIGLILVGNNFANNLAASLATLLAIQLMGSDHVALAASVATVVLTLVLLIFAEVTPKTVAALHPERIAFPASMILVPLMKLLSPVVVTVNFVTNNVLRLFGIIVTDSAEDHLSSEELRSLVHESGSLIPPRRQKMLLRILDLEKHSVEDIMIPRNEVVGVDLKDDLDHIVNQLRTSVHTRLPVFDGDLNNVIGILHLRNTARFLLQDELTHETLEEIAREPYFIPEGTALHTQLFNFQREKRRIGIVVDEYGDVLGVVTLEDILEEIVGEFTTNFAEASSQEMLQDEQGYFLIDGTASLREINRILDWELPIDGPKTLNGLIIEHLQAIPGPNMCLETSGYLFEILQVSDNRIRKVKVRPASGEGN